MKKLLIAGASAAALSMAAGVAQADDPAGPDLTEALWQNLAVNTDDAEIDASIDISVDSAVTGEIRDLSTTAAGAVNEGHIASIAVSGIETEVEAETEEYAEVDAELSNYSGSLNTEGFGEATVFDMATGESEHPGATGATWDNTEAEVYAEFESYTELSAYEESFVSPAIEVSALNAAWNDQEVDASISIDVDGSLAGIDGAATTAVGALNTGTISMGYSGAALNSALNGGSD